MKQYEVEVLPGEYKENYGISSTGDRVVVIITAPDGARAREIAESQWGGPTRCRTSTIREYRG